MNTPGNIFRDRNYSLQSLISLVTANYIVFALAVQMCTTCTRTHWSLWLILAGLAWYNYYIIRRNRDEFAEKRTQIIYCISILGMGILYYLLAVVALHCNTPTPL